MKTKAFYLLFVLSIALSACDKEPAAPKPDNTNNPVSEPMDLETFLDSLLYGNRKLGPEGNLYDKPLQEIQRSIIGKWKVGISFGGFAGILLPENHYITIDETTFDANFRTNIGIDSFDYEWRFLKVYAGYKTYVLWDKKNDEKSHLEHYTPNGYVFEYLLNKDTLFISDYSLPGFSDILIRVKE